MTSWRWSADGWDHGVDLRVNAVPSSGADRAQGDGHGNVPALRALRAGRDDVVCALSDP